VKNISSEFQLPVYEYFNVAAETGGVVDRKLVNTETVVVSKAISSKEYQLVLGDDFVIGKDDKAFSLFKTYYSQSLLQKQIDNLSITIDVHYFGGTNCKVGEEPSN
jgi:hypothetical protein